MVKVSVIVPVYNVYEYIDKCLSSLVNQTFDDFEIIVVNDGSPDNSQEIIDRYVKNYPTIVRSFIKKNGGQGSARNLGIEKAYGKYIMFVDSDDTIEENIIERLYDAAVDNHYDIVICNNYVEYVDGTKVKDSDESIYSLGKYDYFFSKPAVWNKIFLRDLIVNNKILFREKLWYEDFDFTIKMYGLTDKVGFIKDYLYNYLWRNGSTMNNANIQRNLEILVAFDEIIKFYQMRGEYEKYYEYLEFLAIFNIYIATSVRVINIEADKKNKNKVISKINCYMKDNFPNFKKNKYVNQYLNKNRRLIFKLLNVKMYFAIKMIFGIKKNLRR